MAILLIRHGETALNAARIVQHPDTPLSERGVGQAQRLAQRLADFPISNIVSSDYRRAYMTAEAIAAASKVQALGSTTAKSASAPGISAPFFG